VNQTRPRFDVPMAILVGLPRESEDVCRAVLDYAAFHIESVETEAAAVERIPAVMPHIVVVPLGAALDEISERTRAVGAELVELPPNLGKDAVRKILKSAWESAFKRAR